MSYDSFSPSSSNGSPQRLLPPIRVHNEDNNSEWFSVQPGDAILDPAYRPITPRKLLKKSSKTTLNHVEVEPCTSFAYANEVLDPRPCAICHRCRQQIRDCITTPAHEGHASQRPHPGLSSPQYTSHLPRKPSKPLRSMSQPDVSRPARPEEVLSRSFYNHEQGHPSQPLPFVSLARHPVSHQRSRSASDTVGRVPYSSMSHARSHSHQGTMRSITSAMPGPSLPPAPNHKVRPKTKNVAPPTSFRPFTAGSYVPNEPACFSACEQRRPSSAKPTLSYSSASPLPRSHSHSALPDKARLGRLRTNSLSSLSSVARGALSAMTAAPLRNILHPHPQPQLQVSKATACAIASRGDDAWVRVDIRSKRCATMDA